MKIKVVLFALLLIFLLVNCFGKNKQPKIESLWETDTTAEEISSPEEFILPDLSRTKEIDKDSLEISNKILLGGQSIENYKVIDSALYVVVYDVSMVHDPVNPNEKVNDIHILQIGNAVSKTYSRYLFEVDSTDTEMRKSGEGSAVANRNFFPEDIYKNYPEGKITVSHRTPFGCPILKYEETVPEFDWQISGQTKQILSYPCQKATTTFRGRSYEAWFTPEIPLQEGPWKFRGLPGLILEVHDPRNQYVFTCKSFNELKTPTPVKFWEWDYKNTTREIMDEFLRQVYNNPEAFLELYNKELLKIKRFENVRNMIFPYNPMELE